MCSAASIHCRLIDYWLLHKSASMKQWVRWRLCKAATMHVSNVDFANYFTLMERATIKLNSTINWIYGMPIGRTGEKDKPQTIGYISHATPEGVDADTCLNMAHLYIITSRLLGLSFTYFVWMFSYNYAIKHGKVWMQRRCGNETLFLYVDISKTKN